MSLEGRTLESLANALRNQNPALTTRQARVRAQALIDDLLRANALENSFRRGGINRNGGTDLD